MNKRILILILVVSILIIAIGLIGSKYIKNNNKTNDTSNHTIYSNESEFIEDNKKDEIEVNGGENIGNIVIEKGFKSSIVDGNSEEELIRNNWLVNESKFSIKERIQAKNVAENFVQAIASFDIEKPKETVDLAVKYVVDEKKEEIESLYIYLGKNQSIKKKVIEEVESMEIENGAENDYIIFEVGVYASAIDQYDQKLKRDYEDYEVTLLKINGEYKVVSYRVV